MALYAKIIPSALPSLGQSAFPEPADVYDLVVIGAGPGGEAVAVRAAQLGARVALVERKASFGGPSGLTSKAVRESAKRIVKAVDQFMAESTVSRVQVAGKRKKIAGLWTRKFKALKTEAEVMQVSETRDRLKRNGIDLFIGTSNFVDAKGESVLNIYDDDEGQENLNNNDNLTLRVCRVGMCVDLVAKHACIATGSRPNRPRVMRQRWARREANKEVPIPFKKGIVMDATEIGSLPQVPAKAAAVIGGGVIAVEYATVLAELGVGVSLICPPQNFMPFLDEELRAVLKKQMKRNHVLFVEEAISEIVLEETQSSEAKGETVTRAKVSLEARVMGAGEKQRKLPERKLSVDLILYSGGRDANSEGLGLENIGVELGKYGRIVVDGDFSTTAKKNSGYSVFAIGDVIGGGLASTATQQARSLAEQTFGEGSSEKQQAPGYNILEFNEDDEDGNDVDIGEFDDFFVPMQQQAELGTSLMQQKKGTTLFGDLKGGSATDAPLTLWTIPEIASVGYTSEQAVAKAAQMEDLLDTGFEGESGGDDFFATAAQSVGGLEQSIVTGYAYFKDMARGRLSGEKEGFLKVVAWKAAPREDHTLVGVHILGEGANELIQMGSILIHSKVTLQQISMTPFAAVTLSGLYQMACDDALMKLKAKQR